MAVLAAGGGGGGSAGGGDGGNAGMPVGGPGSLDPSSPGTMAAAAGQLPQWTRTRGWTKALLAFEIQFGDRLPN